VKHLYLLRHAKSSWDDASLADHDRPLSKRGRGAARKVADYVQETGIRPELVLTSPSQRTRETLELVEPALAEAEVRFEPELYGASEAALLATLHGLPDDVESVLLLGHNPGMQQLAVALAGRGDADLVQRLRTKMPTAALVALTLPVDTWDEVTVGKGELVSYVVPREL
jgi:phosphohistidine phosphatase